MSGITNSPPAAAPSFPTTIITVRSIQTAFVNGAPATGTAATEDANYLNSSITAVLDVNKCLCFFQSADGSAYTARLMSTTNIRIGRFGGGGANVVGRYYVVEYY